MISECILQKFEVWKKACDDYYNTGTPLMSDEEFDYLSSWLMDNATDEIKQFMNSNIMCQYGFESTHNISSNIGMQVSLKKIKFNKPMDSYKEILSFLKARNTKIYISPKFDGCSININTNNGIIKTRGGQDVTNKLMKNKSIIDAMNIKTSTGIVCGEMLINKNIFESKYSDEYSNARNFVSGILNSIEDVDDKVSDLTFIPYTDGMNPINIVKIKIGDKTIKCWESTESSIKGLMEFMNIGIEEYYHKLQEYLPYMCDGIVISYAVNERVIENNYPTNMVAVKFISEITESEVIDINWFQKKSGKLNPVISINPVKLNGTIVSKASAYNYHYLIEHSIGIGSIVKVIKSGDIIPKIVDVVRKSDNIKYPDIDYIIDGKNLIASSKQLSKENKFYKAISHFDIKGIGESVSNRIGVICDYDIIEAFNPDMKIKFLEKLGMNSNDWRLFSNIYKIKHLKISDVIFLLQFDNVAEKLSLKISKIITRQSNDISNISQDILNNVCRGEGFRKITSSVDKLKSYGIRILKDVDESDVITYEMTGDPPNMTKDAFEKMITDLIPNSRHTTLTKSTNILITNDIYSNTSKMNKARKYNIPIITYKQATYINVWSQIKKY